MFARRIEDSFPDMRAETVEQQERIDTLIAEESDPKNRLTLMILSSINKSISANTGLTRAIHQEVKALKDELETHVVESAAIQNKADGAYKIVRVITPVVWTITCAMMAFMFHSYTEFQNTVNNQLTSITLNVKELEVNLRDHEMAEARVQAETYLEMQKQGSLKKK